MTTFSEFPREDVETSIPARFEKIARRNPNRIAVKSSTEALTYSELNRAANRIAHTILYHDKCHGQNVAIILQQGIVGITAILGVLKTGNCYVPLDPAGPQKRQEQILETSNAFVIVTNNENLEFTRKIADQRKIINIDHLQSRVADENPRLEIQADDFAYILFTSGSTGEPKGVIQNHRNILHDSMCYTNNLRICPEDRVGLLASVWVGASGHYLYGALLNGACLCPLDLREVGLSCLARWLIEEKISFFQLSANVFRHFTQTLSGDEKFTDLRLIALGSSQVTSADVEAFRRHFEPSCILLNRLSTTESRTVCWNFVDRDTALGSYRIPLGYPVEDMEIILKDESGAEVGAGEVGEITVRSRYLSPGYWGRADLTEAVFKSDDGSGSRLFHTGDLGRILGDGALEHLGRKDSRIKIRGFTVEIAEIEKAVLQHAEIGEVAVIAQKDKLADNRLVAYVVPKNKASAPTARELGAFLRPMLPDYMLPTRFVLLENLPLTASGKLDPRGLPSPSAIVDELAQSFSPPATPLERDVAAIWAKVLGIDRVGVDDNFFELGGDSLRVTETISLMRNQLQKELSYQEFFSNPTITEIAAHISNVNQTKPTTGALPIRPGLKASRFPLSVTQQSLWFLSQLDPQSSMYNETLGLRFRGKLDREALRNAITKIVDRHEALRTNYFSDGGEPYQIVCSNPEVELPIVELTQWPASIRDREFQRLVVELATKPFDLSRDLMVRPALFRFSGSEEILVCIFHHIATDGASSEVFTQDLLKAYEQYCGGCEFAPRPLQARYADFVCWQRERMQGPLLEEQLSFWKKQLAGAPELLKLPTDRPRPPVQSYRGASYEMVLSKSVTDALRSLSSYNKVTLFMTTVAAFQVLIFRLSGQEDILVGSPISARNQSEFGGLIGLFLNTLILRTDLSGNPSFTELLERVRKVAIAAYDHQDVPYEKLMGHLQSVRSLNHNTLFQLMFACRRDPNEQAYRLADLSVDKISLPRQTARFDLNLSVYERVDGLRCYLTYATDLFDPATVERMAGYYCRLLEEIVLNPERNISDFSVLSDHQWHQLVVEWNDTKRDYPADACITNLFEAQVRRSPDSIALQFGPEQLTYQALNAQANQLAHYLRRQGVGPDSLVGICLERSIGMVVSLLGILKAGAAYVPLDPNYPTERLAFFIEDAQPELLLTETRLADRITNQNVKKVFIDGQWAEIAPESIEDTGRTTTLDNLAYIIYTSGSTGKPKGVAVTHRGLVNLALSAADAMHICGSDRVLQFASVSFDTSVEEIFPCLIRGGTLVLRAEAMMGSAAVFLSYCRDWSITILDLPTAYWHELVSTLFSDRLTVPECVRLMIIGGERAIPQKLELWRRCVGDRIRLLNTYGPTETTVVASTCELTHYSADTFATGELPIGRPIPNVQIYILDRSLNPVPIGVEGELYIGGAGLARGYLNAPYLTAEKFIANPFSAEPGARLYKTGDLARYLPDGNIEFLGRRDNQVKIRGYRIELGEIETMLAQHPTVRESVVLAREDSPGDRRLVAYVVAAPDCALSASELRNFLQQKLPGHMVPSVFMLVESLPLTLNGKVDRKALPIPEQRELELQPSYLAPRSITEEILAKIWAEVLKVDKVGVRDNFFELGGHSLLAVTLANRIQKKVKAPIRVANVFEAPTVEQFARLLQGAPEPKWESLTALNIQGFRRPFFWVHGEASDAYLPRYLGMDQPLYGLRHQSEEGKPARYKSVEAIAAHYLDEVRSVQPQGPYLLGGYCFGGLVALEMAKQLQAQEQRVDLLVLVTPSFGQISDSYKTPIQIPILSLLQYLYRHGSELAQLRLQEKLSYVAQRINGKIRVTLLNAFRPVRKTTQKIVWATSIRLGISIPASLRSPYILEIYRKAARGYIPQPYQGNAVIFINDDYSEGLRRKWLNLCGEKLRIHEAPGNHTAVLEEPYVGLWAKKLKSCLDAVQIYDPV